ncbi:MAG: hypothetical protein M3415_00645 [Actinomycetota bacterium]|jgi:hypothetical protein|nr:hypothetical protein [Actinomycetota bacterium]
MERSEAAWQRVGEQFSALGEGFKRHQQSVDSEAAANQEQDARDALRALADAVDRMATSVGNALRDPDVKRDAKYATNALLEALGTSFSQLGGELRQRVGKKG